MNSLPRATTASGTSLEEALALAIKSYQARNPTSAALMAQASDVLPAGNTRSVLYYAPFPLYMARGTDCHLWDADGHCYLDALGEFTAGIYGHSNPLIHQAIAAALADGLSLSSHTAREAALAREIQRRFTGMALLRFTNSGTEANLMALAAALTHTGRRKVMVFNGAYHGGVLSFGGGGSPVNVPHDFVVVDYNDLDAARAQVKNIGHDLGAILVEPMLGAGGCIPGEPAFLHGLRALADDCGALLILDEVMSSRLSPGGRQAILGLKPDLTTLGKYFGGGLSFGAFGGREDVMAQFDPRRANALGHAGTFNNNALTMAAGLAGLTQVLTPDALTALNLRGDRLRERLNAMFTRHGVGMQFTGLGSVMQLQAGADERVKELVFFDLLERGIFMARRGMVALSLPFGDAEADKLASAMEDIVSIRKSVLPPGKAVT